MHLYNCWCISFLYRHSTTQYSTLRETASLTWLRTWVNIDQGWSQIPKRGSETNSSSKLYNYLCHSIDAAAQTVRQSRAKLSTAERATAASTPTCRPPSTLWLRNSSDIFTNILVNTVYSNTWKVLLAFLFRCGYDAQYCAGVPYTAMVWHTHWCW